MGSSSSATAAAAVVADVAAAPAGTCRRRLRDSVICKHGAHLAAAGAGSGLAGCFCPSWPTPPATAHVVGGQSPIVVPDSLETKKLRAIGPVSLLSGDVSVAAEERGTQLAPQHAHHHSFAKPQSLTSQCTLLYSAQVALTTAGEVSLEPRLQTLEAAVSRHIDSTSQLAKSGAAPACQRGLCSRQSSAALSSQQQARSSSPHTMQVTPPLSAPQQ
jgi:hypothetical protein